LNLLQKETKTNKKKHINNTDSYYFV